MEVNSESVDAMSPADFQAMMVSQLCSRSMFMCMESLLVMSGGGLALT